MTSPPIIRIGSGKFVSRNHVSYVISAYVFYFMSVASILCKDICLYGFTICWCPWIPFHIMVRWSFWMGQVSWINIYRGLKMVGVHSQESIKYTDTHGHVTPLVFGVMFFLWTKLQHSITALDCFIIGSSFFHRFFFSYFIFYIISQKTNAGKGGKRIFPGTGRSITAKQSSLLHIYRQYTKKSNPLQCLNCRFGIMPKTMNIAIYIDGIYS